MDCKASITVQSTYNFKVAVFFNVSQNRCKIELQLQVNFNRKWYYYGITSSELVWHITRVSRSW